ncbi:MAG TPA: hypothetical protein VKT25_02715, partial [Ktedonobacteraceae bacterium]|nr:hypothetical protein [Ktedonobacteraceae bacterium]
PARQAQPASMTMGPRADFSPAHGGDWQTERAAITLDGAALRLSVTEPPFGTASTGVTVDLDRTPLLLVRVAATTGLWVIKVNLGGQAVDTNVQIETRKPGTYCYDLRRITGWHGRKSFRLMLFGMGRGTSTTFADLRFIGAGEPLPDFMLERTEWQPHQITQYAHTEDFHLHTETGMADANTIVQLATVEKVTVSTPLLLMGQFFNGSVEWNEGEQTLQLRGSAVHATLAVGRKAHWGGIYPSWADWLAGRPDPGATSGLWVLTLDGVREGETIPLAARFASIADGMNAPAAGVAALANADAIRAALGKQEADWNRRLSQVPHPLDFQLRLLPERGVTPARIRRAYYKAWVLLLSNLLPPQPENRFAYPQMLIGKPSLWDEGAPSSRGSSQWESPYSMPYLAWVLPETAWEALLGQLSLAHGDGVIAGEGLPAVFAQTAWALYELTGDTQRLRQAYPALKRVVQWKIREPHWLYYHSTPDDMKEGLYLERALHDMVALTQIAHALALPEEEAYWKEQRAQWGAQYRRWLWASPSGPEYRYFFTTTGKRQELVRVGSSSGWGLPDDILPPASRATLVTLYLKSCAPNIPFLTLEMGGYPRNTLYMTMLWQEGRRQEAMQLAEAGMREITSAGEFSEGYVQDSFPPAPSGVIPDVAGAMHLIFATLWHNGLDISEGMPRCLPLDYTAGVLNLHWNGKQGDILLEPGDPRLEVAGEGVTLLHRPDGFANTTLRDGLPVLRGALPAEGLRLHRLP